MTAALNLPGLYRPDLGWPATQQGLPAKGDGRGHRARRRGASASKSGPLYQRLLGKPPLDEAFERDYPPIATKALRAFAGT